MSSFEQNQSEIRSWLTTIFRIEVENLELKIQGNSEKGDGYVGDVLFIEVSGQTPNKSDKKFSIVLKCSKNSQSLRAKSPVKEAFLSEIYFYEVVLPSFLQFQKDRNVEDPFEKVAKCFGTLSTGTMEFIALENLKSRGYILWDRKKPLTRKHIDMVINHYAKFHAVSIAMKDQEPEKFQELVNGLDNVFARFLETTEFLSTFKDIVQEVHDLLEGEIDPSILRKWLSLKLKLPNFFNKEYYNITELKVITHGDCWNNNFMHFHQNDELVDFAILDGQMMTYCSPIMDLSYFLFSCLSEEDVDDFSTILSNYHSTLIDCVKKLGSEVLYPVDQFLLEWKKYCKFGIAVAAIIHKMSLSEKSEIPDIAASAEKGDDIFKAFLNPIKDIGAYKKRMKYIVKHVVENELI